MMAESVVEKLAHVPTRGRPVRATGTSRTNREKLRKCIASEHDRFLELAETYDVF